ncbi:hypothetical protein SAMN05428995_101420 [Loktanella sp. DSM 29012]|nr:hypothetical protein SAMN05428995_101420 [Loktanella sp. DSM 29012]
MKDSGESVDVDRRSTLLNTERTPASALNFSFEMPQVSLAPSCHIWWNVREVDADAVSQEAAVRLREICHQPRTQLDGCRVGDAMPALKLAQRRHSAHLQVLDEVSRNLEVELQSLVTAMEIGP